MGKIDWDNFSQNSEKNAEKTKKKNLSEKVDKSS